MSHISKSQFLKFIQCYKYLWLYKFRHDLLPENVNESLQMIFDEGFEVEAYASCLFPGGVKAEGLNRVALNNTKRLIADGHEIIFQATASAESLFAMSDIFVKNGAAWDIYEVKRSAEVKDIHVVDVSFQKVCFESAGYDIAKTYLIFVNNQYVKNGEIEPAQLLKIEDISADVDALIDETKLNIKSALKLLKEPEEPQIRILKQCAKPYDCPFASYCHADRPEHSIYDIAGGLSEKKLNALLDQGILEIKDIPEEFLTNEKQRLHQHTVKHDEVYIEKSEIKKHLAELKYPLYFIDYETFAPAIPLFDGYRPYQRIVFQYSLHVQDSPKSKLRHYEFLANEHGDPTPALVDSLKKAVTEPGTFISWNSGFEKGCNTEMAKRVPEHTDFLQSINDAMFDLMLVFKHGHYVHKDFHGRASLKKVLPVLVPKLSYKKLNIQEGETASASWQKLFDPEMSAADKKKLYKDMLAYCELDTLAMVEILGVLRKV